MDFVPLLVMAALVKKIVDMVKFLAAGDTNAAVTQIVAWLTGIAAVFIAAKSDFGNEMLINGLALSSLNNWALVFAGLTLASTAGVGWDAISAVDNSNSATTPRLLRTEPAPPRVPAQVPPTNPQVT